MDTTIPSAHANSPRHTNTRSRHPMSSVLAAQSQPAEPCPLTLMMRSFLRVVTACPQQQLALQQQQAQSVVGSLPDGCIVEDLGELNYNALQHLVAPPVLASVLPQLPPLSAPVPSHPGSPKCSSTLPPLDWWCQNGRPDYDWMQTQAIIHVQGQAAQQKAKTENHPTDWELRSSLPSLALASTTTAAALPLPVPAHAATSSPISHTALYQSTLRQCGIRPSDNHGSIAPSNVLTLLHKRAQGPCLSRSSPAPKSIATNLSMTRIPDWMKQVHHYEARVFGSQFSHSGDTLAVATQDQHIRLYEVETHGTCEEIHPCSAAGDEGQFLFDSRPADCSTDEESLSSYNLPSCTPCSPHSLSGWRCIRDIRARQVGWAVVDTDFSPDDKFLAYSTWSPKIQLVGCAAGSEVHEPLDLQPQATRFCVFSVKFSPDSKTLLAGSSDRHIYLYDLVGNRKLAAVQAHCADINSVAWMDDCGSLLATGGDDCLVKLWDVRCLLSSQGKPAPVGCFVGHTQGITSLSARGDGRHLLTNSKDQSAKIWDVRRTCPLKDANEKPPKEGEWDYRWARFQPKPSCTAAQIEAARVAQAQAMRSLLTPEQPTPCVTQAATAARNAACSLLSALLPAAAAAVGCPKQAAASTSAPAGPPSAPAAATTKPPCPPTSQPSAPAGASTSSPPCRGSSDLSLMTFTGHRVLETLIRAYWSPLHTTGQRYIYSGSQTGVIHIWDCLTGEVVKKLNGHYGTVRDVCWHPREPILVSSSWDCTLARWECS